MCQTHLQTHTHTLSRNFPPPESWMEGRLKYFCLLENNFQANSMIPCQADLAEEKSIQLNVRQSTTEGGQLRPKKAPRVDFTGSQSAQARGALPGPGLQMGGMGTAGMERERWGPVVLRAGQQSWQCWLHAPPEAKAGSPPDPIPNAWRSSYYLLLLSFYVEMHSLQ